MNTVYNQSGEPDMSPNQMMAIIPFGAPMDAKQMALIAQMNNELPQFASEGVMFNRIGTKNSRFRIVKAGEPEVLVNAFTLDVIILGWAPNVGRLWFGDTPYVEGQKTRPQCWSADGNTPDAPLEQRPCDVANPQSHTPSCQQCYKNTRGSAHGGGDYKGCQYRQRLVVALAADPSLTPFVLDVSGQGLFADQSDMANNIFPLRRAKAKDHLSYTQFLAQPRQDAPNGVSPLTVVTRLSFAPNSSTPALRFQPVGYVPPQFLMKIRDLAKSKAVTDLIEMSVASAMDDRNKDAPAPTQTTLPATPAIPQATQPAPVPVQPAPASVAAIAPSFTEPVAPPPPPVAQVAPLTSAESFEEKVERWLADARIPDNVREWAENPQVTDQMVEKYITESYPAVAATPAPAPAIPSAAKGELDVEGMPWDARIHSSSRNKNANGTWRILRGVDKAVLTAVTAELKTGKWKDVPAASSAPPVAPPVSSPITASARPATPGATNVEDKLKALAGAAFDA